MDPVTTPVRDISPLLNGLLAHLVDDLQHKWGRGTQGVGEKEHLVARYHERSDYDEACEEAASLVARCMYESHPDVSVLFSYSMILANCVILGSKVYARLVQSARRPDLRRNVQNPS